MSRPASATRCITWASATSSPPAWPRINVALFDAIARGFGVRVCDLIGGCGTTRIPAYASTGFFSDDPDRQLAHMLAEAADHPYAGAKIKIGRGIKSDVERVRQAREALGPDKLLLVDINGAYTRRRGAGVRAGDRAVRHPLDRGAAAAGRPRAAMPSCGRARRSRWRPARRTTRCATSAR